MRQAPGSDDDGGQLPQTALARPLAATSCRLYLLARRGLARDALAQVLQRAGHRVIGADEDADIALQELGERQTDLLLADLRWGTGALLRLLGQLDENQGPRVLVWRPENRPDVVESLLPRGRIWAWVAPLAGAGQLLDAVQDVADGRRQPPPWPEATDDVAPPSLSPLDETLLLGIAQGLSAADQALGLGLTARQVAELRRALTHRLKLPHLAAVVRFALHHGLITSR
ncbi:MAG: hypothetical protein RLY78_1366 [Pseudomonadota bacterium]|jgi:DNA-binding NarL/FixJ family response regulator|uniref:Response regulator transcription factor n=1 Tax=Pseudaquabacterium rugosum TaxID=2984194 RepID=A0ABU9BD87_9BURK